MTFAVRVLSLFLTIWLTAASAFPPCCWSMTYTHQHHETPAPSSGDMASAEHRHHHGSGESAALAETAALTSIPAYDCDAEFDGVATITSVARPQADTRAAGETSTDVVVPPVSAPVFARADFSPPGASCSSAFQNPLRI